jgi:hypothetical protein
MSRPFSLYNAKPRRAARWLDEGGANPRRRRLTLIQLELLRPRCDDA